MTSICFSSQNHVTIGFDYVTFIVLGHPTCAPNLFTCPLGRCISQYAVCNGYDNCRDGSYADEKNCTDTTCRPNYVRHL